MRKRRPDSVLKRIEPLMDRHAVAHDHRRDKLDALSGGRLDRADQRAVRMHRGQASKHLGQMPRHVRDISSMSEHFEEIVVADKVEPRESSTLALEVLAKRRLDPVQELGEALERGAHARHRNHVEYVGRFQHLFEQGQKLTADTLEARTFHRQDVRHGLGACAGKDAMQVHPLPLHVGPQIKDGLNAGQALFPHLRLFLKHTIMRTRGHCPQAARVLVGL